MSNSKIYSQQQSILFLESSSKNNSPLRFLLSNVNVNLWSFLLISLEMFRNVNRNVHKDPRLDKKKRRKQNKNKHSQ